MQPPRARGPLKLRPATHLPHDLGQLHRVLGHLHEETNRGVAGVFFRGVSGGLELPRVSEDEFFGDWTGMVRCPCVRAWTLWSALSVARGFDV